MRRLRLNTSAFIFITGLALQHGGLLADENTHEPETQVSFVNTCSGKKVAVSRPRESYLNVEITNLRPGVPLWVEIQVKPARELPGVVSAQFKPKHLFFQSVPSSGKKRFTRKLNLHPTDQVWNASVRWTQGQGNLSGGGSAAVYSLSRDKIRGARFFQVKGPVQCVWESALKVSSEYHYNSDAAPLTITRQYSVFSRTASEKGVDLGLVPSPYGTAELPMFKGDGLGSGWIFSGMKSSFAEVATETLIRKWNLSGHQGGMFGDRISFNRIPAAEYVSEIARSGCRHWVKNREGHLDVGKHTSDFYVVPQDLAGSPEKSAEFMEKMRPTLNTCGSSEANGNPEFLIAQENDEMLFFYENN